MDSRNKSDERVSATQAVSDAATLAYYRDGFHKLMMLVTAQVVVIFGLTIGLAFYLGTHVNGDRYYAETIDNRAMPLISLPSPNMGRDTISNWAAQAASQVMTFGFNNINESFAVSKRNFTTRGWELFRKAVMESSFIDEMVAKQQILTSVPESPPILRKEGLQNGVYSWTFDVRLLMTFRAGSVKSSRVKTVTLIINRISTQENPSGIGIGEWYLY